MKSFNDLHKTNNQYKDAKSTIFNNISYNKFNPKYLVIHSTISPHTTQNLQKKLPIPVIYSATRGVHKRMLYDLKRYTKFFAIEADAPNVNLALINSTVSQNSPNALDFQANNNNSITNSIVWNNGNTDTQRDKRIRYLHSWWNGSLRETGSKYAR